MLTRFILFLCCLAALIIPKTHAQQYPSRNFTTVDGLPNNAIRSLFFDSRGLLWIGTENGLSKMENNVFQNFDEYDGLAFNSCWAIEVDPLGQMWFGSYGGGLTFFDGQTFRAFRKEDGLINQKIRNLFYFEDRIWVGTENGVSAIDIRTMEIISLPESISSGTQSYVSGFFVHNQRLHYTTYGDGVFSILPSYKNDFRVKKVNDHKLIYAVGQVGDTLLLSNKGFVQRIHKSDLVSNKAPQKGFGKSVIWDYAQDNLGAFYAAAWGVFTKDGGLFRVEGNQMMDMEEAFGVTSKVIMAIAYNPLKNMLYMGSNDKGLFAVRHISALLYEKFNRKSVLGFARIFTKTAVLHDQGLSILDERGEGAKQINLAAFKSIESAYVRKNPNNLPLHQDGFFELDFGLAAADLEFYEIIQTDSTFWVSSNLGIFELDPKGSFLTYLPVHTFAMGFIPDGKFIDSNPYDGLRVYQNPAKMNYRYYDDSLVHTPKQLSKITNSVHKTYFSSVFHGLFEWKEGQFTSYIDRGIWAEEKLKALHLMDDNTLVVGSEFGDVFIVQDNDDGFKIMETIGKSVIEGKNIVFLESYQGNILIGTEKGLTLYQAGKIRFFDEEQGFQSKIFQTGKVMGDELWVGTSSGYYRINLPMLLSQLEYPSALALTDLEINHVKVPKESFSWFSFQQKEIELAHHENTVYLTFKPIGHLFPEKLQYRYRLKPGDEWSPSSLDNTLSLPYLPPGTYPVEVEVLDKHRGTSSVFPLLTIKIKAPYYFQAWFIVLFLLSSIGIVYSLYRIRVYGLRQKERSKASVARRLAETKLEALRSQMNPHFIFNAINSIQYSILKNDTEEALEFLVKFSKLIRKTLDNSSKLLISLEEEINYLQAYFEIENARMDNRVKLDFLIDPGLDTDQVMVPPMLLQPFVENAFVHAFHESHQNPEIHIDFHIGENSQLNCRIRDNGAGLSDLKQTKIHKSKGVSLVKERLHLLDGAVTKPLEILHSELGTLVWLSIPYNVR